MGRTILILQGHPDTAAPHLCHALADAYAQGAREAGHEVRTLDVARLEFPLLRSQHEWEHGQVPPTLAPAQQDILWAQHIVVVFPLWLGDMPAVLKAFFEQVARPGFAFTYGEGGTRFSRKGLGGRTARVVATMGMPAAVYRWYFRAHSLRSLERNILGFVGIAPVHETLVGRVGQLDAKQVAGWLSTLHDLGQEGA